MKEKKKKRNNMGKKRGKHNLKNWEGREKQCAWACKCKGGEDYK